MIQTAYQPSADADVQYGNASLISAWQQGQADGLLWVDIFEADNPELRALLGQTLGFHPLAISDALREKHPPKIEHFADHTLLIMRGLDADAVALTHQTIQLAFFMGERLLVTVCQKRSVSTERVWGDLQSGAFALAIGPVRLTSRILRAVVDRYAPILVEVEKRLSLLEDQVSEVGSDQMLGELISGKTMLKKMHRTQIYHCDAINDWRESLLGERREHTGRSTAMDADQRHELNDLAEHFERVSSLSSLYQELADDLINGYLSISSHKLNQIMKVFTGFTVVFLPLSLMTGIYGMNFDYTPQLHWHYGYYAVLASTVVLIFGGLIVAKWRRWF